MESSSTEASRGVACKDLVIADYFLQCANKVVKDKTGNTDNENCNDDGINIQAVPSIPHEKAHAAPTNEHFCGDDNQPGGGQRQAQASNDAWQGSRQPNIDNARPPRSADSVSEVNVGRIDAAYGIDGVNQNRL